MTTRRHISTRADMTPAPKPQKPERGTPTAAAYLALVAQLPCICCRRYGVQCHHPIMGRFSQSRSSDMHAIPLCREHHYDLHNRRAEWISRYGRDVDYVEPTQEAVKALRRNTIGGRG